MSNQRIGLDLGNHSIKIARIGQRPESYYIEDSAVYPAVGTLNDKSYYKALKDYLEEYTKEHEIKKAVFNISIAPDIEEATTLNLFELPTADDKVIKRAVKFELEQQEIVSKLGDEHYL